MERLIDGLSDDMARTLDRWLYKNIKPLLPEKFDTREKIENNPEEVALILDKRGIEVVHTLPTSDKHMGKITRFWVMRDKLNDEVVSTLSINIKTGNEVL